MSRQAAIHAFWSKAGHRLLPFADAASDELPLGRLVRLSLFQVSVGMCAVLLTGTLNRVMILELGVPASVVAIVVALPFLLAPARALLGFRSDTHRSYLGWRRVPYIWFGSIAQFGGLAIMPFALLLLQSQTHGPSWAGEAAAALAFLLTGIGVHTVQTAGLALATDLSPEEQRPRVVALLYVMLLAGMLVSAVAFSWLLADFGPVRLIQVIQGAAVAVMVLNLVALWKQEPRRRGLEPDGTPKPSFAKAWTAYRAHPNALRALIAVALGTVGFSMQDVLLEPYGGEVLALSVSDTTMLTALLAAGTLAGLGLAARALTRGVAANRLAGFGLLAGVFAFSLVIFAAPLQSAFLFRIGTVAIGFGGGLFAVGTLIACMAHARTAGAGLALGAWGAVQASAMGLGLAAGGLIRDGTAVLAKSGTFGSAFADPALGYSVVYHLEIGFLFAALVAIGPTVRAVGLPSHPTQKFGLAEFPG